MKFNLFIVIYTNNLELKSIICIISKGGRDFISVKLTMQTIYKIYKESNRERHGKANGKGFSRTHTSQFF